ncbi:MAG: AsmA-like C-terminal region-containing protein [Chitinophagales bacterium]|nr:AsmA-like C-terminal region-containing protein [Chitinophagales bacterium]
MEIPLKKRILTVLTGLVIVVLALLASGMLIGVIFGDRIKQLAIGELNKKLATEVVVKGSIDFSVLANFPSASITFNQVTLRESLPSKEDLLQCDQISLLFNIWDVFRGKYKIKKVMAENGYLNIRITEDGHSNYNIFKPATAKTNDEFSLKMEEAILNNIILRYDDNRTNRHFVFDNRQSTLSGDFTSDTFLLKIVADGTSEKCSIDNIDYLPNRKLTLNSLLRVNLREGSYELNETILEIEMNLFTLSGKIITRAEGNETDLHFGGTNLRIEELAALLPEKHAAYISHFSSEGTIRLDGSVKGMISAQTEPHVSISFGVKNGTFSHDKMKAAFKNVSMDGEFSNGASNSLATAIFKLQSFTASFDENTVTGMMQLQHFNDPFLDLRLDGKLNLELIKPLFPSTYIHELKGSLSFRQFYFKGAVKSITNSKPIAKIDAGGSFSLADVTVVTNLTSYDHLTGAFDIQDNQIMINQLSFNAKESDLNLTGSINNFIPYFLSSLNDSVRNNHKIGLDIEFSSHYLSWTDLVGAAETTGTSANASAAEEYAVPSLFYILSGSLSGKIDKFSYEKFQAGDVHGRILFLGNAIYFNDFGLKAEQGTVVANGKLDIGNVNRNKLELTASLDKMDITQLFYEFNNFSQTTLTDHNLKGLITANVALQATWDENIFNKNKLYAIADVTIDNGELNNFDPMLALAKFVKMSELKNIRFSRLQNQVEIRNGKIYIPQMQIFTNALNIQLSGTHSFENIIDYKIQLNLLKLLTSKFEKSAGTNMEFDKTTEGFLNLYLTMTGAADNPMIRYDKKAVKEKIATDLKQEKNELKTVLKREFDQQEKEQQKIKDWQAPAQFEYMEFDEDSIDQHKTENQPTMTKQEQQKELDNFKQLFKPKDPAPK